MMCDHCDRPLKPGEDEEIALFGASGAGATVHVHRGRCPVEIPEYLRPRTYSPPDR